jgi:hypothetical protein
MTIENRVKKTKAPWPTKDAMTQIYDMKLWGGKEFDFYSGDGSHHPEIVNPYIEVVKTFLESFSSPLKVCDLGCGDFNIGSQFVEYSHTYIAVDIVDNLIKYNKEKFKKDNLEFQCLDITADTLPPGDCVILRQVLQHLSNAEVQKVLCKLANFKYVILTEHLPKGNFVPNKNIISGQGIRLKKQSGLDVLAPPFNFHVQTVKDLFLLPLKENKGVIKTSLYTLF